MAANQRERLLGAAVAAFPAAGYRDTRVKDLLDVSGVSRSTFYKHFANKDECFLAALEETLTLATERLHAEARELSGPWDARLERMLGSLAELIVDQPSASRLALVEVHAAGPRAIDLLDQTSATIERLAMETLRESPERADLPADLVRSILGGLRMMVLTRLREGREDELPALVPDVLAWIGSYEAPPDPLRQPTEVPADVTVTRGHGDDPRGRVLRAVTELVAERGYADLTINDIADRAAMSLTTFYEHFDGASEAFLATLADAQERLLASTRSAYEATDDWPRAINAAARRFIGFLATDPTVARLGVVEAWTTGPEGFELRAWGRARFHDMLERGFEINPRVPPIAAEAIGASADALLFDQLRRAGAARLYEVAPTGVFLVLAPFTGSPGAAAIANDASASLQP